MKGKINYPDEPIGKVKLVEDFLPSPEELEAAEEGAPKPACGAGRRMVLSRQAEREGKAP